MPRPTRHAGVPPDLGALADGVRQDRALVLEDHTRTAAVLGRLERLADAGEAGAPLPGEADLHHLALLIQGARQLGAAEDAKAAALARIADDLSRLSREAAVDAVMLAAERAEGRAEGAQARHSHRKPRGGRKPSDGQVIPFRGRAVTGAIAAASLAAGAAGVTLGPGAVSDLARWSPVPAAHHAVSLPSLGPESAVLIPSPAPPAYQPRHAKKPSADAASASPAPSPPVTVPATSQAPPSPAPSRVAFDGQLDVQTDHLVIGPLQGGQVTFTAVGGSLSWTASAPAGLVLDVSGGILRDGQAVVITVSVAVGTPAGSGAVVITDGEGRPFSVPVSWAAVPAV